MRRRIVWSGLLSCVALATAATAAADPGPGVTDDPGGARDGVYDGYDGAGFSTVEPYLGTQSPAARQARRARNISLVGSFKGAEFNQGVFADVAGYKNLAFLGRWRGACPGTGIDIIDISRPSAPVKLADTLDHPDTSMEDMEALSIGGRDVLAVGLQDCGNDPTPGVGRSGVELYDVTVPRNPRLLSFFDVDSFGADVGGVHELDLTTTPSGRVLALLSVPNMEADTSDAAGLNGTGDLLLLDVTDPARPSLAGEWGVLDEPTMGLAFYLDARQGADGRTLLHSPRANADGTRAYLSYWDAGVIMLDISSPGSPVVLGRTSYRAGEEGNAHSVADAREGALLVQADEDFNPFHLEFTSNAFVGTRPAVEGAFTGPIVEVPGRAMSGDVVYVGRGCPAGSVTGTNPDDPYLADPTGKIALIERGGCRFDNKLGRAQLAGATGVIVFNSVAGGDALVLMGGQNPMTLPDGSVVEITIPGVFVGRSTGILLRDGAAPVTARAAAIFDGWGYLRFFDISDPANPRRLGTFATANTNNEAVATSGTWSVHNPEIRGSTVYASWYSDGVRVIDLSRPAAPQEIGFWTGAGAPADAPAVNIWSVVPHGDLLLASDRNYGLYVLKLSTGK